MTKCFFHSATSIKSNVLPYVESQNSQNQHTQFYSYAGNSNKYQIFNTQQTFDIGNLVSVWLRIEDINKPIPTKTADVMVFFLKLYKRYSKMKDIFWVQSYRYLSVRIRHQNSQRFLQTLLQKMLLFQKILQKIQTSWWNNYNLWNLFDNYWHNNRWNLLWIQLFWVFVNGAGVVVTNFGKLKNYKEKIEMTKTAFTTYEKVLVELRSALRGDEFDKNEFIDKMKIMDEMIINQTPLADRFSKRYNQKYNQ